MKFNMNYKKLTFMIIPDTHQAVRQLILPRFLVIGLSVFVPVIITTLLVYSYIMYTVGMQKIETSEILRTQIAVQSAETEGKFGEYEENLASKHDTIERLQNEVISLSQQAAAVKVKLESLQELENDIRGISNTRNKPSASLKSNTLPVTVLSAEQSLSVGGLFVSPNDDGMEDFVQETSLSFGQLGHEIELMLESYAQTKEMLLEQQRIERFTPNIWPVDSRKITSAFGYRKDPFTRRPSFHEGTDISGSYNDPVYAAAEGKVIAASKDSSRGNYIEIDHSNGVKTTYMHLRKLIAVKGDIVSKGQLIGLVGSSGRSTGPHLHYEIKVNGKLVNPLAYLIKDRKEAS